VWWRVSVSLDPRIARSKNDSLAWVVRLNPVDARETHDAIRSLLSGIDTSSSEFVRRAAVLALRLHAQRFWARVTRGARACRRLCWCRPAADQGGSGESHRSPAHQLLSTIHATRVRVARRRPEPLVNDAGELPLELGSPLLKRKERFERFCCLLEPITCAFSDGGRVPNPTLTAISESMTYSARRSNPSGWTVAFRREAQYHMPRRPK